MKLSKSKLALAKVINENGGWPSDDANFAAQDKIDGESNDNTISFYSGKVKPTRLANNSMWRCENSGSHFMGYEKTISGCELIANWHQTCLSIEEYYHAYPKADADGWIEWKGGECPVGKNVTGDIKLACGEKFDTTDMAMWNWHLGNDNPRSIIAYRLHKPEVKPEFCESVMRSIPEPELDDSESRLAKALELVKMAAPHLLSDKYKFNGDEVMGERKPTIERLAQDYRNKMDYASRKQQEADDAKVAADAALGELERAGEALWLLIGIAKPDREPELVITDWRDLQVNDVIFVGEYDGYESGEYVVAWLEDSDYDGDYAVIVVGIDGIERCMDTAMEWRFISRP